jgi:hypothetical protein
MQCNENFGNRSTSVGNRGPSRKARMTAKTKQEEKMKLKNLDDLSGEFANAATDAERAQVLRAIDAMTSDIADAHQRAGRVTEYRVMAGLQRQAHMPRNATYDRVRDRMAKGEI